MKKIFLASTLVLAFASTAQAGWGDLLNAAAQVAGGAMAQPQQNTAAQNSNQQNASATASAQVAPISTNDLEYMSCANLQVNSRQAKRDLEENRGKLQQLDALVKDPAYQQQKSSSATMGMIGNLMAQNGKGSAAEYGRALAQNGAAGSADGEIELQLALNKKLTTDIENIDIYLQERKCGR
ncbi:MAG: hypothetical protein ACEQSD_12445 [Flavobacteriales bacterium]